MSPPTQRSGGPPGEGAAAANEIRPAAQQTTDQRDGSAGTAEGAPLGPIAEHYAARGWQLVPTQWHRTKNRAANTPVNGVTGRAPFPAFVSVVGLVLHREGGPDCTGRYAKPAVRPPPHVVGFDVDDGYAAKTGGDTLVEVEMALGPLPGTWSLTARGPWTPSRRRWFRIPPDLVVGDRFFTQFGGCIETIRTGHRYSWCAPAIHVRKGKVVGPVLWYDQGGNVTDMPHVDQLPELPASWVAAIREHNATRSDGGRTARAGLALGEPTPIATGHADAIVNTLTGQFHELAPEGGDFRSALFGLAAVVTRRSVARGHGEQEARDEIGDLFAEHPWNLTPDEDDERWITDGVEKGLAEPWGFVAQPATATRWVAPLTKPRLRGLILAVLTADEPDRTPMLGWLARKLAGHVDAGHLTKADAGAVITSTAARVAPKADAP